MLEAARSQIAGTVSQAEVASLPLNGRNFLDLALLVPGVSPTNVGSTQLFAETSAVPGVGLSVGSQRNFSNNFIVDGLSANDDAAGLSGMPYGVDAVDQFQVVTSGGQAELGRALGGYVNVVTKSGTNASRGDLYGYFRDDAFNAANALSGTKLPMTQKQYGGSLGGPIAQRPHVLLRQRRAAPAGSDRADDDQRRQRRDRQREARGRRLSRVAGLDRRLSQPGSQHERPRQGRSPVQTANDQFSVRYSLYDVTSSNSRGAGALNAPVGLGRPGQPGSDAGVQQHVDPVSAHGQRDPGAVRPQRSAGAADRSHRPRGEHRRRGVVRHARRAARPAG